MAGKEFPLSLIVKAVDKATAPLKKINDRIEAFQKPFKRLNNSFVALGKAAGFGKLSAGFSGVGTAFGGVGKESFALAKKLGTLGALGGIAFAGLVKHSVDAGDELAKTADRVGLNVDAFSQLSFVAGRAGISQDEFTTSMDQFNLKVGQASMKTGSLFEALKHTPAEFQKAFAGAKTNEQKLNLMFDALDRIKDPGRKAAFAKEVFGKSGLKMGAMGSPKEIAALRKEYLRISGAQEKWARSAEILNDAMGDVETAFTGVTTAVMAELFPSFIKLAGVFKEFLIANRDGIAKWARTCATSINDWVSGGGMDRLAAGFERFSAFVSPLVEKMGGWPIVIGGIAAAIVGGPLLGSLAALAGAFGTLGVAMLATPIGWAVGLLALVAGAAAFALAKDEALHQNEMKRVKTLGLQKIALDDVEFAQGQLNAVMKRDNATADEVMFWSDRLDAAKKQATKTTKDASAAVHDDPTSALSMVGGAAGLVLDAAGARAEPRGKVDAQQAQIKIDIAGAPRGTRVTEAPSNTANVDLSLGVLNPT